MKAESSHRRQLLQGLAAWAAVGAAPRAQSQAQAQRILSVEELVRTVTAEESLVSDGIRLQIPGLADNGHVVPVRITVDSPMSPEDHVRQIQLLSTRNPVSRMALFTLGPWSGRAEIATRVRLAGTQTVVALARPSSGPWRIATAEVVVTESACLDLG